MVRVFASFCHSIFHHFLLLILWASCTQHTHTHTRIHIVHYINSFFRDYPLHLSLSQFCCPAMWFIFTLSRLFPSADGTASKQSLLSFFCCHLSISIYIFSHFFHGFFLICPKNIAKYESIKYYLYQMAIPFDSLCTLYSKCVCVCAHCSSRSQHHQMHTKSQWNSFWESNFLFVRKSIISRVSEGERKWASTICA